MKRQKSGFTLIELLLVIVIITLLISLLSPLGGSLLRMADQIKCQKQLGGLSRAYLSYAQMNKGVFPPLVDQSEFPGNGKYRSWLPPQYNYLTVYNGRFRSGFGPLVWHGLVSDLDYLICPRDRERMKEQGREWWTSGNRNPQEIKREIENGQTPKDMSRASYSIRCFMHPWQMARLESGFQVIMDNGLQFEAGGVQAIMACRISTVADVLNRHVEGAPVAYLDGSVEFRKDEILWDDSINKLDGNFQVPANQKGMMEVWHSLDER